MRPIVLILGPTAGGKTSLAIELARMLDGGGECICADSMQVYRGMDIGTAKPTKSEQKAARHHVLDITEPSEEGFTVDDWLKKADKAIAEIRARNSWPIVVGGTNLYVQSLLWGMFEGPDRNQARRAELDNLSNRELQEKLLSLDQESATRIHINDKRRMIRAIEVYQETGKPISLLQSQWSAPEPREDAVIIGLSWSVDEINRRINSRVKTMLDQGFLEEVKSLQNHLGVQAREALGYKQLLAYLRGECSIEEAVEQIKILTRRYGKQQRTWLRRFQILPFAHFISMPCESLQVAATAALAHILGFASK